MRRAIFLFLTIAIVFCSCDKKTKTAIENIELKSTETPQRITQLDSKEVIDKNATTFILVRHAEKVKGEKDPELTEKGIERADELASVLRNIPISNIYSSDFRRTKLTVQKIAMMRNMDGDVKIYEHRDLEGAANQMMQDHPKGIVLVSGHSNTTPKMINILTKTENWQSLDESDYDNLYLVSVYENAPTKVLHFKYGEPNE